MSASNTGVASKHKLIVVGNGMVGHRFCERLHELDVENRFEITVFGEEPRPAYDRVHLSEYFTGKTAEDLCLGGQAWYNERGIQLNVNNKVTSIRRDIKQVQTSSGECFSYDTLILCTGSSPFVPPVPGIDKNGVFVYRTIEDLEAITKYAINAKSAAVMGGGLLGLEAAKAVRDLGLETHVVEFAPRLMPRQLDTEGASILAHEIEAMGVKLHLDCRTESVLGNGAVVGMEFADKTLLDVDMLVVSAGIRPRDELARECGIETSERGGVIVDNKLQTNDPNIFAIGEVALFDGMIYGLVGPGYDMAEVVSQNLTGGSVEFVGADMSSKLKLMGVEVASFGDPFNIPHEAKEIVFKDAVNGIYKKVIFNTSTSKVLGGILVGDSSEYGRLLYLTKSGEEVKHPPEELILGQRGGNSVGADAFPDEAQICSCNNVSKGVIRDAINAGELTTLSQIQACTKAGTTCGGCASLVTDILDAELKAAGKSVKKILCEHFAYTRQELFEIVKIQGIRTFTDLLTAHGQGDGCETCKPAAASIFASLWNEPILKQDSIQDTNDRFLANIQRGGTYSVIPRIPGGEITPDKLIVLGEVAKKYNLYCKITGGQRIDLLGAAVNDLPEIWETLIAAGFESGHAYGKALRTVKSCVGQSWCRFGVQDSTTMAIRVENRYRGLRAPHKIKSAVSGCTRECAEAQSKDFGLIATEQGWNLYVCGNGGTTPRHADLLAGDLDAETAIRYIDRFLMYYIRTADKLTRTARWIEKLEGGVEHVRDVVVNDSLGLGETLEAEMETLVQSYACEWADVVNDPDKRAKFQHFVNDTKPDPSLKFITERNQKRPADWPVKECEKTCSTPCNASASETLKWWDACSVNEIPENGGACIKYGDTQIAVFNFSSRGKWYATDNLCPHKKDMVLARGLLGDFEGIPKVACPHHKKQFSLESGECISGGEYQIKTYPIQVVEGRIQILLPQVIRETHLVAPELQMDSV